MKARGAIARREEKACKATVNRLLKNRELVPLYLLTLIREPNKDPIDEERDNLLLYPLLTQVLNALLPPRENIPIDLNLEENELEIRLVLIEEEDPIRRVNKEVETKDKD